MAKRWEPRPVTWAGHSFRSTLEARWAVIFTLLGIRWEYEPMRFTFSDGLSYVPDFLLHGVKSRDWHCSGSGVKCCDAFGDLWVEVKGNLTTESAIKITSFHRAGHKLYLVGGNPIYEDDATSTIYPDADSMFHGILSAYHDSADYYSFSRIDGDEFGALLAVDKHGLPTLVTADGAQDYSSQTDEDSRHATYHALLSGSKVHFQDDPQITELPEVTELKRRHFKPWNSADGIVNFNHF